MKNCRLFWLSFDLFLFLILIFAFDVKRQFSYVLLLVFQIFLHFFSKFFKNHIGNNFYDAHYMDFKKPEWWVFVVWAFMATLFDWKASNNFDV